MIRACLFTALAVVFLVVAVAANPNWGPIPDRDPAVVGVCK